ncbi:MAG: ATP-binding protein [Bacteroidales bacterium]|nr:ATP-binding protein [Bacteroidales bacterium]
MEGAIKIPSDMSNIYRAERLVDSISEKLNIGDEQYGNILVCIVEAVSNAIQHGNQNDVTKIVYLSYSYYQNKLNFIIEDEGNGFDLDNVPDPTLPENVENIKGRGIFLIRHLSDEIKFENKGSKLYITFYID